MARPKMQQPSAFFYENNFAHLTDELRNLDLLIQQRVGTLRQRQLAGQGVTTLKGVYISHEEADQLLGQEGTLRVKSPAAAELRQRLETLGKSIEAKINASAKRGILLALPHLARLFNLSSFELQTVVVCLAPELRRKYDTLFAYVQDDITRKRPSVDLVLDLLCASEAERWSAHACFTDEAPLFRHGFLHVVEDPRSPSGSSGLAQFLQLNQRVLNYILGNDRIDGRLEGCATLLQPSSSIDEVQVDAGIKTSVENIIQRHFDERSSEIRKLTLYFHGPYGVGKREFAQGLCARLRCPLLYIDMESLLARETEGATLLRSAFREGLLQQAAVYVDGVDGLLQEDRHARAQVKALARALSEYGRLTFLAAEKPWSLQGVFHRESFCAVGVPVPDVPTRQAAWERALRRITAAADSAWPGQLARQFRLTPGQIEDATAWAEHRRMMRGGRQEMTLADLYAASRSQSYHRLGELAVGIEPRYGWQDIVLPADKIALLKEICTQVTYRHRVYSEWGFDRRVSHGKGLSALFAGPSGTGKTLAAEVIAHELELDLYKIDLSGVVSKYIGETEKNLAKIFQEAEASNAILFFDEADALFGKRTKISDAHDRYVNIETSYLLQRMEAYEGIVILATNLRENMDEAFTRRIKFIIDFPFPDAANRKLIWRTHFPQEAPVSPDLDYEWLAKQFQLTGGNIKNIVLNAAFSAAADGGVIGMTHVLRSAKREFVKIGKLWNDKQFVQPHR